MRFLRPVVIDSYIKKKKSVRLSENMWGTHELTKEAMDRSLRALKGFVHMANAMEVDTIKSCCYGCSTSS